MASLRRDGFVSMQSKQQGYLATEKIIFDGSFFFVNADVKGGLQIEIQDEKGKPIPGYTKSDCIIMKTNSTKHLITWKNKNDISALKNKPVKVKFYLTDGELYSFWISKWKTGESRGYTAGGGPGLSPSGSDIK